MRDTQFIHNLIAENFTLTYTVHKASSTTCTRRRYRVYREKVRSSATRSKFMSSSRHHFVWITRYECRSPHGFAFSSATLRLAANRSTTVVRNVSAASCHSSAQLLFSSFSSSTANLCAPLFISEWQDNGMHVRSYEQSVKLEPTYCLHARRSVVTGETFALFFFVVNVGSSSKAAHPLATKQAN